MKENLKLFVCENHYVLRYWYEYTKYLLRENNIKGENIRAIIYKADFQYIENGKTIVEDVKGMETKDFKLKKKILEYKYPDIDFRLIK